MLSNRALVLFTFFDGLGGCYVFWGCFDKFFYDYGTYFVLLFIDIEFSGRDVSFDWLLDIWLFLNCLYPKSTRASSTTASFKLSIFLDLALCTGL